MASQRHFEDDPFPEHCDHCPAELGPGVRYRRALLVLDGSDSFVGGERATIEDSYELVLCASCQRRLTLWLLHPLPEEAEAEQMVEGDMDDSELAAALAKELFVLEKDPEPRGEGFRVQGLGSGSGEPREAPNPAPSSPEPYVPPPCHDPACPVHGQRVAGFCIHHPDVERLDEETILWPSFSRPRKLPEPENMLGAADQFGGDEYEP